MLDAAGLDAFQRFVKRLPEGCELRVSNLEFQPLRYGARWRAADPPPCLLSQPRRRVSDLDSSDAEKRLCIIIPIACWSHSSTAGVIHVPFIRCGSCCIAARNFCCVSGFVPAYDWNNASRFSQLLRLVRGGSRFSRCAGAASPLAAATPSCGQSSVSG